MKLSEYAERYGIPHATAQRHAVAGLIPGCFRLPNGFFFVPDNHDFSKFPRRKAVNRDRDQRGMYIASSTLKTQ